MNIFYTYFWLRPDGTPYYVGKGKDNRAIRRGSPKDLDCIIIQEHESEADAFEAEKFFISYYGRKDLGTGILRNLTDGGEGHVNLNPEVMQRKAKAISLAKMGHTVSEVTRTKLRNAFLGNVPSEATRLKLSKANTGHSVSEETRRKIGLGNSKALRGRKLPMEVRLRISEGMRKARAASAACLN